MPGIWAVNDFDLRLASSSRWYFQHNFLGMQWFSQRDLFLPRWLFWPIVTINICDNSILDDITNCPQAEQSRGEL